MAVDVGSAKGYLDLDISGFLSGLRTAQNEADSASKNIATKIGKNFKGIGKSITSVGSTLTKTVTVPLLGIGAAGLKVATNFEKGMSEVKAISGATGEEFEALREKAIELGADTAFSAGEVAEAMTEMAKAGWNSEQIIAGMSGVLSAAAASGEGLAVVSTIVADTITGFGLAASDSTKIADLLTQAANSGTIGITDLGESFKYIAPVAGSMGLSVEDVTTALSAMSMAGIKGSAAGTALRTILTNLVKPTDAVATAMEELGIEATNSDGSMKSLDEIVSNLRTSFDGLTESEKAKYAATLAGKEGMSGMLALLNLTQEEYDAIAASMDNANGIAEETAAVMQDNLQSKVEQLGGSLESLAIKLAEHLIPHVQNFVIWLTSLVDKFTALDPETQKTILAFAGIAAIAGPVLAAIGSVASGVGTLFTVFGQLTTGIKSFSEGFSLARAGFPAFGAEASKLGAAIGGISAPVIAVVAVIAVLVAAFVSLWKNNEDFRNKITAIWEEIKATFQRLGQGIVDILNKLGLDFESIGEFFKAIWKGFCDFVAPLFIGTFQYISDTFNVIVDVILGILDFWISVFTGDWQGAWEAIKGIFISIWDAIVAWFKNVGNTFFSMFEVVLGWFGTSWSQCWNGIKTFFVNTWNGISTFFTNTWNGIKNTTSNAINSVKNFFTNGFNAAKNTVTNIFDSIKNKISSTMDSAKNIVSNVINKIKGFFNFSWSLPKLKMPHVKISGEFSLVPPRVPTFSIEWYKKAMSGGMILNSPTIFGYDAKSGQFLGGGEAGSETIVGTSSLMSMIRQAVADAIKPIVAVTYRLAQASNELGYITYNSFAKQKEIFDKFNNSDNPGTSGGDTFNFYSPKPIDEIEAAKQMKKAKRDLAEGF